MRICGHTNEDMRPQQCGYGATTIMIKGHNNEDTGSDTVPQQCFYGATEMRTRGHNNEDIGATTIRIWGNNN